MRSNQTSPACAALINSIASAVSGISATRSWNATALA
jgi:hypothetical protein